MNSYTNCENKKIPLKCKIIIKKNQPIKALISSIFIENSFYNNINFIVESDIVPEDAINSPITKERILQQFLKTSNTPYEFSTIDVDLDNNLYIPHISSINELRRKCLEKIENIIIEKYCNRKIKNEISLPTKHNNNSSILRKELSINLNYLNLNFDYSLLNHADNIYVPFKYFINKDYITLLKNISEKYNLYISFPVITRKNYTNIIINNISNILSNFKIKGFVISNIGSLNLLKDYINDYKFIANYTLNLFNDLTQNELNSLNCSVATLSPELNKSDIINFNNKENLELIVYGNTPIMNMNYCLLGKSNHCYSDCHHKCNLNNKFYIKDRLGFEFRLIPDNIETVTTIFNSKTTFIDTINVVCKSYRIDILDEDINEINNIISCVLSGKKIEGKNYTNGNFNRLV